MFWVRQGSDWVTNLSAADTSSEGCVTAQHGVAWSPTAPRPHVLA